MPGWKDEYLTALLDAERSNPVSFDLVEACTLRPTILPSLSSPSLSLSVSAATITTAPLMKQCSFSCTGTHLNDRIATLEAEKAQTESTRTTTTATAPVGPDQNTPLHTRTRADLAHTLTQKTHLEARLRATTHDRDRLLSISKSQQKTLGALTAERDALARKVRDQASELRGKKDLLQQVQDDMLALEMELNASNAARARLLKENKELVDRWMLRVAGEANAMNSRNERGGGSA